jgi:Flp pilus assembly protein CpaB
MRGRRTLLIVLVVIIDLVVVAYFVLNQLRSPKEPDVTVSETVTPPSYVDIVVSAQNPIPRGWQFQSGDGAVSIQQWPADSLPPSGYSSSADQLNNMYAAQNIPMGTPILTSMLSEAVIAPFPEGRVGYGLPMDIQGGLGWHIQEGDHVDVLAAIKLVNVDTEFQSRLPNLYQALPEPTAEGANLALSGVYGRFETLPNGMAGMIMPNGDPYPQLIVQLTVQDAIVWHIGAKLETAEPTPVPEAAAPASSEGIFTQAQPETTVPATLPTQRGDVELVSLLVTPQDALILKYLYEVGADLDLVIRAPGDTGTSITGAVWSRYILDRYQVPQSGFDLPVAPTQMRIPRELTPIATPPPADGQQ